MCIRDSTTTDQNGMYTFKGIHYGNYTIVFHDTNYYTRYRSIPDMIIWSYTDSVSQKVFLPGGSGYPVSAQQITVMPVIRHRYNLDSAFYEKDSLNHYFFRIHGRVDKKDQRFDRYAVGLRLSLSRDFSTTLELSDNNQVSDSSVFQLIYKAYNIPSLLQVNESHTFENYTLKKGDVVYLALYALSSMDNFWAYDDFRAEIPPGSALSNIDSVVIQ